MESMVGSTDCRPVRNRLATRPQDGCVNAAMRYVGPAIAVACMAASGFFLWLSLKHIPMGTAYAVWTGIGSLGAFLVGVYVFGDTASLIRWAGIALVVSGIVCLKMG